MINIFNQMRFQIKPHIHKNTIMALKNNSSRTMAHLERPGQRVPMQADPSDTKGPIKFTTSEAFVDYRATNNFHGGDDRDLPKSHNAVLAATGIFGFYYLIFLRDDVDADGGAYLFRPLHETVPELAIPLIQSAIAENKRLGYDTTKLEKKLRELLQDPDKYGGGVRRKLVEN
jgi:hypothetical protein